MTMAENSSMTGRTLAFDELTGVEVEGMLEALHAALQVLNPAHRAA
jgi:hypothetical protein